MSCACTGTIREPCLECYRKQLREAAGNLDAGPAPAELEHQLHRAGVPAKALDALRDGLNSTKALTETQAYLKAERVKRPFLPLLGDFGRGKTLAACWAMREVLRRNGWKNRPTGATASPVQFISAASLTGISEQNRLDTAWTGELERFPLLVVDDLGDEGGKAGVDSLARVLLNRYAHARRTILTSNLRGTAFEARYGKALWDRIRNDVVQLAGDSMRTKNPRPS
jgi:DNA replication protein DnaC